MKIGGKRESKTTPKRAVAPARAASPRGAAAGLTHEAVARRAFEIYLGRGGHHGRDVEDWFQAEKELRQGTTRRR